MGLFPGFLVGSSPDDSAASGDGAALTALTSLWWPSGEWTPDPRAGYPITVLGGLKARFKASPALVAAIPGGLLAGVPDGRTPIPYATIVEIGTRDRVVSQGAYRVVWTTFLVAVAGRKIGDVASAYAALDAAFSPAAIFDSPIPLRAGEIREARLSSPRLSPSVEADRGGNLVRRKVANLTTISVEWSS